MPLELVSVGVVDVLAVGTGSVELIFGSEEEMSNGGVPCELESRVDLRSGRTLRIFVTKESDLIREELSSLFGFICLFLLGEGLLSLSLCVSCCT